MRGIPSGKIDVTAPKSHLRDGIRSHVSALPPEDRTVIDAIPVTSLYRTLLDEAPKLSPQRLRSRLEELERRDLIDARCIDALLARNPTRAGSKKLKAAIAELTGEPQWTQSRGERDMLELVRAAGLPEPSTNVYVAGELVDFVWWRQRLIVEIDHYGTHGSKRSFEDDRLRDTKLQRAGFRVMRVTYERLGQDPVGVLADIRALLAEPAAIGSAPP
jgi:very-short-patch-repair endonuclease